MCRYICLLPLSRYHCLSPVCSYLCITVSHLWLSCVYLWVTIIVSHHCISRGQILYVYILSVCLLTLPVLRSTEVLGWLVQFGVSPETVTAYDSPQLNWLKVQYDALVPQPTTPPVIFAADTLNDWSTPVEFHHTVAMLVLHSREIDRFSALQGADGKKQGEPLVIQTKIF